MRATGIEVRPCADTADEERSLAIYNAVRPRRSLAAAENEWYKRTLNAHADYVALVAGEPVGSALIAISPSRPEVGFAFLAVLPERRGRGVGRALYATVSEWLATQGLERMDAPVEEDDTASFGFAERRGFVEIERNSRLFLDLRATEPPPLDLPAGIAIATWAERPDLARAIYAVACEAQPDIPGGEDETMEPFEAWLEHEMQGPSDRPEATFLALAGDEVVGYAKFSLSAARPTVADHDITGVKRAWRGRGIAGALKRAQIRWATGAGYERLETENEVRNAPMRRVNERLGYRPAPGQIVMRGPIAEAATRA